MAELGHFGIVGAGLQGRVLALGLLAQGHHVDLFDRDTSFGNEAAGMTAAGMLAPFAEVETAQSDILRQGFRSIGLWPDLVQMLGIEHALQQQGSLLTAHSQDLEELALFIRRLKNQAPYAYKAIQPLDQSQIQTLEPALKGFYQAWYLPQEGQVDSRVFMQASHWFLSQHPRVRWRLVKAAHPTAKGTIETTPNHQRPRTYDHVFDCRGLGATQAWPHLRGVRGEVMRIHAPDVALNRPVRLMHPRYRIYVVPRAHHQYVIGATEIEANDETPLSVRSSLELLSATYSLHAGFGEARILESRTACRPALPDNLPAIETQDRCTKINGLYRHGYLLAPALAQAAMAPWHTTAEPAQSFVPIKK